MLHPKQFHVNEAWIAFKLNGAPLRTDEDGDFDFIALMDAASCFILGSAHVPSRVGEPSKLEAKRLLKAGYAHKRELPKTLFIPTDQPAQYLEPEAKRQGITVVRIPEDQLLLFIAEARQGFGEHFGAGGTQ